MPNEGSYGGKIEVRKDGSVLWQVAAREFPKDRDTDGSLEYAIRIATTDRNTFSSRDGKCLVKVDPKGSQLTKDDRAKFLIVSGYETPTAPYDTVSVGRSYFITYARYVKRPPISQVKPSLTSPQNKPAPHLCDDHQVQNPPHPDHDNEELAGPPFKYDLSIRYDDYDLDRAGLPFDSDPERLEVCYQNFVSLSEVFCLYHRKRNLLLPEFRKQIGAEQPDKLRLLNFLEMTEETLENFVVWTMTYRHLRALGISRDLIDDLQNLILPWDEVNRDIVYSRWLSVGAGEANSAFHQDHETTSQRLFSFDIKPEDLKETLGFPRFEIAKKNILSVPGSRTISLRGLNQPGTFVLMFLGDPNHYD